ncbi:hypothetical protein H4582DRAFT_2113926 [Lactarius indigo]|nr:hypothetical protein H4582DRAFT_2113926 [Lactarius indigo]
MELEVFLNWKLLGKATALDDHKQWIIAIATSLVQVGLKNKAGIKTLIQQYECAAEKLYQPKGYLNEDVMRSIMMLRLGGAHVVEFAHCSLSLLILRPLIVSLSVPTVAEIEANIHSCHSGLAGIGDNLDTGRVVHQVIMFNELTIEHNNDEIPLEFTSERELNILCDAIDDNRVHLASEATVTGIGALSKDPHEYAVWPRETGLHHSCIIQTVINGANKTNLSANSPIYGQLSSLKFMNNLVSLDDLTADKDFKHVFKCQRNLLMCQKGTLVQGFCITPAILRAHLELCGVPSHRLWSLLNPNDKQDIVLAYSLLKEIWSLPPLPASSSLSFSHAWEALNVYGQFAHHLMMPYVCINLDLDEQLIHLSTVAHMVFFLYRDCSAHTQFMLTQSYVDIMIMIKNVFYCVAKAKVNNPHSNFYLILLGTDCLETFFGLIRTAVGTDTNIDILQLGSQVSGLTEVALILMEHPEWDPGTCHLTLPCITKDAQAGEITSKFDHISPKDWRGNATITRVNLHSCWLLGWQQAITCIPEAGCTFKQLLAEGAPNIDMLSPLEHDGKDNGDGGASESSPEGPLDPSLDNVPKNVPGPPGGMQGMPVNNAQIPLSYTHDGDLEDAIAKEMPRNNIDSAITVQGQKTLKAKALRHRMAYRST